MSLPTACPMCSGSRAHEKSCGARHLVVDWPDQDPDDLRAEASRQYAARTELARARHATAGADAL